MIALLTGIVLVVPQVLAAEAGYRRLPAAEFRDKMQGAWLGQMIGVGWGQPTEFHVRGGIIPEELLVVIAIIAIIAILAALLLPALTQAKERANRIFYPRSAQYERARKKPMSYQ